MQKAFEDSILEGYNGKETIPQPALKPILCSHYSKLDTGYLLLRDYKIGPITVPCGFESDLASIPEIAWNIIGTPYDPQFAAASIVHDWGYYSHCFGSQVVDRKDVDMIFKEILSACGVDKIKVEAMHAAVRMFGSAHWENDTEDMEYLDYLYDHLFSIDRNPESYWSGWGEVIGRSD